jgi:hypothetical protein
LDLISCKGPNHSYIFRCARCKSSNYATCEIEVTDLPEEELGIEGDNRIPNSDRKIRVITTEEAARKREEEIAA